MKNRVNDQKQGGRTLATVIERIRQKPAGQMIADILRQSSLAGKLGYGWRIQMIKPPGPALSAGYWLAIGSVLIFLGCESLLIWGDVGGSAGLILLVASMGVPVLVCLVGGIVIWIRNSNRFVRVSARCIDREIRYLGGVGEQGLWDRDWHCRIFCEFTWNGKKYQVTPQEWVFTTKSDAEDFLAGRISTDDGCSLLIDQSNPLRCKLQ